MCGERREELPTGICAPKRILSKVSENQSDIDSPHAERAVEA